MDNSANANIKEGDNVKPGQTAQMLFFARIKFHKNVNYFKNVKINPVETGADSRMNEHDLN